MAKRRVHEIAKAKGITSKELLAALHAAGVDAKAAQSNVEEADAERALAGSPPAPEQAAPQKAEAKAKPAESKSEGQSAGLLVSKLVLLDGHLVV